MSRASISARPGVAVLVVLAGIALGLGPSRRTAHAQSSEAGFQAVLDALDSGRQTVLGATAADGTDRAEGLRFLLRMVEMNLASYTDDHDTAHPGITRCPSKVCSLGFPNPDNVYLAIGPIDDRHTYRVSGNRATVHFITLQVFNRGALGGGSTLTSDELEVDSDGRFEILLGPEPQPGNWLRTDALSQRLIVRNVFEDWDEELEPSFQVEVLGDTGSTPVPVLSPETFEEGASGLAALFRAVVPLFQDLRKRWPQNAFVRPDPEAFGMPGAGFPSIYYSPARYEIAADQALIVESPSTRARYRNIQLGNLWLEAPDYASRQTSLNGAQAHLDDDGVYRYVLAHSDPGVPNWLDVGGRPQGTIFMRWQSPPANDLPPTPRTRVVPLAELRAHLPANHPTVTPAERARILERRQQAYNRFTNPAGLGAQGDGDATCPARRLPDRLSATGLRGPAGVDS